MAHIYDDHEGDAIMTQVNASTNGSDMSVTEGCNDGSPPKVQDLFRAEPVLNLVFLAVAGIFVVSTLIIFIEEVSFVIKHFEILTRRVKTIWVLAIYPVFSVSALLGLFVPRAGTLVDLVSNVYFSTCLFQFVRLMVNYMGGEERMYRMLGDTQVKLRGPPCCCCCPCLPSVPFSSNVTIWIRVTILQVVIFRPFLFLIAAVLWTNGSYATAQIAVDNGYAYIAVMNLISTFTAVYGLLLLQKAVQPALESFHLSGKFLCLQSVLLLTVIPNIIINMLVSYGVIPCSELLPSKTRGERIYHAFVITLMLPLALLARGFYRREEEGKMDEHLKNGLLRQQMSVVTADKSVMTSCSNLA